LLSKKRGDLVPSCRFITYALAYAGYYMGEPKQVAFVDSPAAKEISARSPTWRTAIYS